MSLAAWPTEDGTADSQYACLAGACPGASTDYVEYGSAGPSDSQACLPPRPGWIGDEQGRSDIYYI